MKGPLLLAILIAACLATPGAAQTNPPDTARQPKRCSEEWLDQLVEEAAKAQEHLAKLKTSLGSSRGEADEDRLMIARADSAAATADAYAGKRECQSPGEPAWEDLGQALDGQEIVLPGTVIVSSLGAHLCVPYSDHPNRVSQCMEIDGDLAQLSSIEKIAGTCIVVTGRFLAARSSRDSRDKYSSDIGIIEVHDFVPCQ